MTSTSHLNFKSDPQPAGGRSLWELSLLDEPRGWAQSIVKGRPRASPIQPPGAPQFVTSASGRRVARHCAAALTISPHNPYCNDAIDISLRVYHFHRTTIKQLLLYAAGYTRSGQRVAWLLCHKLFLSLGRVSVSRQYVLTVFCPTRRVGSGWCQVEYLSLGNAINVGLENARRIKRLPFPSTT